MASIKTVTIEFIQEQPDERLRVLYSIVLTDDLAEDHETRIGPKLLPKGTDVQADALATAQAILDSKPDEEAQDAESAIEDGTALERVQFSRWGAASKIARRLILLMIRERDPRIVVALEPLIQYLQSNYNANQMASWLDLSVAQILQINRRVSAILNDTGTVKNLLASFDAEQADWD